MQRLSLSLLSLLFIRTYRSLRHLSVNSYYSTLFFDSNQDTSFARIDVITETSNTTRGYLKCIILRCTSVAINLQLSLTSSSNNRTNNLKGANNGTGYSLCYTNTTPIHFTLLHRDPRRQPMHQPVFGGSTVMLQLSASEKAPSSPALSSRRRRDITGSS